MKPSILSRVSNKIASKLDGAEFFGKYRLVRASWDASERGGVLKEHWRKAHTTLLDPNAEATPDVLRIIRSRVRQEYNNNGYCRGIVNTVANYVIGTGPKLRLIPRGKATMSDRRRLYDYANMFNDWAWEIDLARKMRVMCAAKIKDGEGFAALATRGRGLIRLNVKPFECDLVTHNDPARMTSDPDGVEVDAFGEVKSFMILPRHPGNTSWLSFLDKPKSVSADRVIQWFDESRPGLLRGVPEIAAGLKMFAQLSRYSSAVVNSAETAAEISAVLKTNTPPQAGASTMAPNTVFELEHNAILTLPGGWEIQQINPTQPGQNHEAFLKTIIREIGRGLGAPYAVAAADASGHNYSSMRGDWQGFFEEIKVRRNDIELQGLEKIRLEFDKEARLVFPEYRNLPTYDFYWDWPGYEHVDPLKVAEAQKVRLENRTTTLAREFAKEGLFYEDEIQQQVYEQELTECLRPDTASPSEPKKPDGKKPTSGKKTPMDEREGDDGK